MRVGGFDLKSFRSAGVDRGRTKAYFLPLAAVDSDVAVPSAPSQATTHDPTQVQTKGVVPVWDAVVTAEGGGRTEWQHSF